MIRKQEELLLRETIRQIVREELVEEGKVSDFFKRLAGVPLYDENKLGFDLDPKLWFMKYVRFMNPSTLGALLRGVSNAAKESGSSFSPEVESAKSELRSHVVTSLKDRADSPSEAEAVANRLIGIALAKAHGLRY